MNHLCMEFINLFLAGLLAGEEFVIRYGVSGPLAALDQKPQIRFRQALILRLRVLVPILFVVTAGSGVVALIQGGAAPGFRFRCAGVLALFTFIAITLIGTVPINKGALAWQSDAPPNNWRALVRLWERLDTARCWAAALAFACFLAAVALQQAGG